MGVLGPPVSPALQSGAPPAPAPLPHAPLPRRPLLRSRGKSSFKNTSSKAPSVSGGGCRGRGGREGDAAALDTEVTGQGGGRGRRACTGAHVCACTESTWLCPASVSLPTAAWMASCQVGSPILTAWSHPSSGPCMEFPTAAGPPQPCCCSLVTFHTGTPTPAPSSIHQSVGRGPSWVLLPLGS